MANANDDIVRRLARLAEKDGKTVTIWVDSDGWHLQTDREFVGDSLASVLEKTTVRGIGTKIANQDKRPSSKKIPEATRENIISMAGKYALHVIAAKNHVGRSTVAAILSEHRKQARTG